MDIKVFKTILMSIMRSLFMKLMKIENLCLKNQLAESKFNKINKNPKIELKIRNFTSFSIDCTRN